MPPAKERKTEDLEGGNYATASKSARLPDSELGKFASKKGA